MASGIYRADGTFQPFQATGLTTELATRQNAGLTPGELEGWLNVLPDPDPVLRKRGDEASVLAELSADDQVTTAMLSRKNRVLNCPHFGFRPGAPDGDTRDQRSYTFWATWWLSECWRIAREGSPLLVFTDWRQLPTVTDAIQAAGWLWRGVVVWQKPSARPAIGEFRREAEFVIYGSKGKPSLHSRRCFPGVFKCPVNAATKVHITGKPVALLQELMGVVVDGGTVLDPFLGGGTTAHAALLTGRKCIGVELSPEYAKLSAERLLEIA